jgi:hypothetical protein
MLDELNRIAEQTDEDLAKTGFITHDITRKPGRLKQGYLQAFLLGAQAHQSDIWTAPNRHQNTAVACLQ